MAKRRVKKGRRVLSGHRKAVSDKRINRLLIRIVYIVILIVSFLFVYQYVFDEKIDLNGDNASYYILGKALSQGDGFRNIYEIEKKPHNHFPPGYPVLIAGTMKVLGNDINTIKRMNGLYMLASLILLLFIFNHFTNNIHLSFIACLFVTLNITILRYSYIMMSEMPFILFSIIALLIFINTDFGKPFYKNASFYLFVLVLGSCYYIRTAGIALIPAFAMHLIFIKRWDYLVALLIGFNLIAAPWFIRGKKLGGNSYLESLTYKNPYRRELGKVNILDFGKRIIKNSERYVTKEFHTALIPGVMDSSSRKTVYVRHWIGGFLLLGLIIIGMIRLKRGLMFMIAYIIGTGGILLLWPEIWYGPRFILPVIPFLILLILNGVYSGVVWVVRLMQIKERAVLFQMSPFLLAFALIPSIPQVKVLHQKAKSFYPEHYQNYFDLAEWSAKNLAKEAIVCCRKPVLFYLFSGRYTTNYSSEPDIEEFILKLKERNISYVIYDRLGYSSTSRYLYPAIKRHPEKFSLIRELGDKEENTILFKFNYERGYFGEWENGKKNGEGKYYYGDGRIFEGTWVNDLKNGHGVLSFPDGKMFEGTWVSDQVEGTGVFKDRAGNVIQINRYKNGVVVN